MSEIPEQLCINCVNCVGPVVDGTIVPYTCAAYTRPGPDTPVTGQLKPRLCSEVRVEFPDCPEYEAIE